MKKFSTSLFIFRRDLRLHDNTALLAALRASDQVIPTFIFDSRQLGKNPYRGDNLVQFMLESLIDLNFELQKKNSKLYCWRGVTEKLLPDICTTLNIEAIFFNKDYTPFAIKRDQAIKKICEKLKIAYCVFDDALLTAPGSVLKSDNTPYKVYTPFYRIASQQPVPNPIANRLKNYYSKSIKELSNPKDVYKELPINDKLFVRGGRSKAVKLLKRVAKLNQYDEQRDLPGIFGTSGLSAYLKFGCISVREVFKKVADSFGSQHTLIRELYWRDFFTQIVFHFPHVFSGAFHRYYDKIEWENDKRKFKAWCAGKTGFPIVDAGMRQLNTTGFMHNRVRMIVASFLTKDLLIDWRWGEKYFANKLVDYDPAVNNGNWQWAASTGCDAQPYFRIFNPWRQQERFDSDATYIKRWIPELSKLSSKEIHQLVSKDGVGSYPAPIVDHSERKELAEDLYITAKDKK